MLFATAEDLALELGADLDVPFVRARFERWLTSVEARIRQRIPDLDALVASKAIDEVVLNDVIVAVAARHARNPEEYERRTMQVDDAQVGFGFRDTGGRFALTDDEWLLIEPARPRAYAIMMGMPDGL